MLFTILPEKVSCSVLTQDNVLAELKKAGWIVNFHGSTSLSDLDLGTFDVDTKLARLESSTQAKEIDKQLKSIGHVSAQFLSLARLLIENPSVIDGVSICIQNAKPDLSGNFVYAVARRLLGERSLSAGRISRVWGAGSVFLVRPQD